jgi:hypothetical protein
MPAQTADLVCLQCGTVASRPDAVICRRCGLRYGEAPPLSARLASCPICYRTTDDDGRIASQARPAVRLDINAHVEEHEQYPVGDDAWLETLREYDVIRIGRWTAPFDLVRHYLVTGAFDAGRNRLAQHNAIVTAMTQIDRWGRNPDLFGDQEEWRVAREAVAQLMDRYHARGHVGLRS